MPSKDRGVAGAGSHVFPTVLLDVRSSTFVFVGVYGMALYTVLNINIKCYLSKLNEEVHTCRFFQSVDYRSASMWEY